MVLRKVFASILVLALATGMAQASSSQPASLTREFMIDSVDLSALSLGVDGHSQDRAVRDEGSSIVNAVPELSWVTGFIGLDVAPCWTVFATVGDCDIRESGEDSDSGTRWSVGMNLNLLKHKIENPAFIAGNLSVQAILEAINMGADIEFQGSKVTVDWTEYSVALPVSFEMYAESPERFDSAYSLLIYAGPIYSPVDGRLMQSGTLLESFESYKDFGLIAGVDIYLSENLSLGAKTTHFDKTSFGGTIRYHF